MTELNIGRLKSTPACNAEDAMNTTTDLLCLRQQDIHHMGLTDDNFKKKQAYSNKKFTIAAILGLKNEIILAGTFNMLCVYILICFVVGLFRNMKSFMKNDAL